MMAITINVKPWCAAYKSGHRGRKERGMKVSKETSARHRDELLNAASRLFRERGFDKVGIAEIAATAGLTHGAFYRHFESKEALCAEVIARAGASRTSSEPRKRVRGRLCSSAKRAFAYS
jgi:AcrR family transcriptional regulator